MGLELRRNFFWDRVSLRSIARTFDRLTKRVVCYLARFFAVLPLPPIVIEELSKLGLLVRFDDLDCEHIDEERFSVGHDSTELVHGLHADVPLHLLLVHAILHIELLDRLRLAYLAVVVTEKALLHATFEQHVCVQLTNLLEFSKLFSLYPLLKIEWQGD